MRLIPRFRIHRFQAFARVDEPADVGVNQNADRLCGLGRHGDVGGRTVTVVLDVMSTVRRHGSVAVMTAGILLGSGISAADVPAASPNPTPEVTDAQSAQSPTTGPTLTEQDDLADPSQSQLYDTTGCRIG